MFLFFQVNKENVNEVVENVKTKYSGTPSFYLAVPSDGARVLKIDWRIPYHPTYYDKSTITAQNMGYTHHCYIY